MNGRNFGDTGDLFKYDLVRHIMKSLPELTGVTLVPMVTESGGSARAAARKDLEKAYRTGKAGSRNIELKNHLATLQNIDDPKEYIGEILGYFDQQKILAKSPGKCQFTHANRDSYFRSVFHPFPKNSLIVLDPDRGIGKDRADDKHLLLSELKSICKRMDTFSILMVHQHIPRGDNGKFIRDAERQVEKSTGFEPTVICDKDAAFFLIAKTQNLDTRLKNSVGCYADTYPALECKEAI